MASTGLYPMLAAGQKEVFLGFRFRGVGATTGNLPTANVVGEKVVSVNHTATGRYTVTLDETFTSLESLTFTYQDTNYATVATRRIAILITETVASTKTLVIAVEDGAGAAVDLAATQTLHVQALLDNVTPVT